ncbi:MAG: hypothetical protein JO267_13680, partial [Alphaproteobacteria bacterium]|nr:hypothetical protein [Alphaproteobacteria bacterium]
CMVFAVDQESGREAGNEQRFEFKFFHLGNAALSITAVELVAATPQEAIAAPSLWRLLGRLQKGRIGRQSAHGEISVSRWQGPGCLLYGGWPYLRLPRGPFRLSVHCRPGVPRRAWQAVLTVEILGRSAWRNRGAWRAAFRPAQPRGLVQARRAFLADELERGPGIVDFTVPVELSLDCGGDAPFEIRLFHSGNADLTIEAIDLSRLGAAAQAPEMGRSNWEPAAPALPSSARKKIVIIGNCQCEILRQGFTRVESLSRQFDAAYHFITLSDNLLEFARRDLEQCDILLVQDIKDWDGFVLRDCVPPGVEPIRFPLVRCASLWPFDAWNGPGDKEAQTREGPNLTFPYLDGLLARLRREIADPEARFAAYRSLDVPGVINYRRVHAKEELRLAATDRKYGTQIGAYILDHFRQRRILHTTVRPGVEVMNLLMQYVLKCLGVRGDHALPGAMEAILHGPQVPVHPKVAADLGVTWANERTGYLFRGETITWETYIRRYIAHYG